MCRHVCWWVCKKKFYCVNGSGVVHRCLCIGMHDCNTVAEGFAYNTYMVVCVCVHVCACMFVYMVCLCVYACVNLTFICMLNMFSLLADSDGYKLKTGVIIEIIDDMPTIWVIKKIFSIDKKTVIFNLNTNMYLWCTFLCLYSRWQCYLSHSSYFIQEQCTFVHLIYMNYIITL